MKIRISVSEDKYDLVKDYLAGHGIETGEDGEYMITEAERFPAFLTVRDEKRERLNIRVGDVIFIEAYGKDIEIHTAQGTYFAQDRIYQLEELLDPQEFLRVSKSVIISRRHVKKIRPSLSLKYILTMTDGTLVDVTRSYYSDFRKFFGI